MLAVVLGATVVANLDDFDSGVRAFQAGDYEEAVTLFRNAAEQGDAIAQGAVGEMYFNGQDVVQDNISAHMWWSIAATNGSELAAKKKDIVAKDMTVADISEAQRRAKICMESNYQNCD